MPQARNGLAGERWLAGVLPGGEPEGTDVSGGIRKLADEDGGGLIVEAVVVFVGKGVEAAARVAVGEEDGLKPTVGAEACFESIVCWVRDEHSVVGTHGEERAVT